MSKRRSIILSVTVEGLSQADAARLYGVSRGWVSKLMTRYRFEGEAAFEPRSRRRHTSPNETPVETIETILELRRTLTEQGLDAGGETIRWHLREHHGIEVSAATIRRHLIVAGLIMTEPPKRPKSSYIRFQADLPNETWQTDMTHIRLADSTDIEVLTWLDDHSRYALNVTAFTVVNGPAVVTSFRETAGQHGHPASVLSDNGMYCTARLARTTPTAAYTRLPKTGPAADPTTDYRIRQDRIDKTVAVSLRHAGRMHHIGIGRAHKHVAVTMLIANRDIRVINTQTGELLRALTLNPTRGYQPRFKNEKLQTPSGGSGLAHVLTHHTGVGGATQTPSTCIPWTGSYAAA